MRVVVVRGTERIEVEVDPSAKTVAMGGRHWPYELREENGLRTELEIAGERVVVEGWPAGLARPPGPVAVNGERWTATVEAVAGSAPEPVTERRSPVGAAAAPGRSDGSSEGEPILPPMPGRILEVRVKAGDRVEAGALLLVLEAMKMRNEIVAPRAGRIGSVRVVAGASVRAREPMLYLVSE
ncbi:MAG: biotin/lipoyl-containing protein [Thermoplasmata archaeon]